MDHEKAIHYCLRGDLEPLCREHYPVPAERTTDRLNAVTCNNCLARMRQAIVVGESHRREAT